MKDNYGNKIGICKCGCTKEETPLYAKGLRYNCYWKSRRSIRESKTGTRGKAKANKSIPRVSKAMVKKLAEYKPLRDKYMATHEICEVIGCNKPSQDLHHMARRGKNLCNVETFLAVCRSCHIHIEENPTESKELGYLT